MVQPCVGTIWKNGLATPEDYAHFATWMVQTRGYKGVKLHGWMPPMPGAPDVRKDYKACAAVREAVGPEIPLMLDPHHFYSRFPKHFGSRTNWSNWIFLDGRADGRRHQCRRLSG